MLRALLGIFNLLTRGSSSPEDTATDQTDGMRMEPQETWKIFHARDGYRFVRHLDILFPDDAVLYLDGCISQDIQEFVGPRGPERTLHLGEGPRVTTTFNPLMPWIRERHTTLDLHMLVSRENLDGLCRVMEHHAGPEVCEHLHVYRAETVIMEGHDWTDGVFYVTGQIPEEKVNAFCAAVGCRYRRSLDLDYAGDEDSG